MKEGCLDQLFDVLDAHTHPCIIMGRFALRWMGTGVFSEQPLDLLIRNKQVNSITVEILGRSSSRSDFHGGLLATATTRL